MEEEKTKGSIKKAKTRTQRKEIFTAEKSVLKYALKLYDVRSSMINAFKITISILEMYKEMHITGICILTRI